jgi:hypothetical protein
MLIVNTKNISSFGAFLFACFLSNNILTLLPPPPNSLPPPPLNNIYRLPRL